MNTRKFMLCSLLLTAVVVAVMARDVSVDNKKGATVERNPEAKDSQNQGNNVVETGKESNQGGVNGGSDNAEVDNQEKNGASYDVQGGLGGGWGGWGGRGGFGGPGFGGPGFGGGYGGPGFGGGGWRGGFGGGPGFGGGYGGPGFGGGGWRGGGW